MQWVGSGEVDLFGERTILPKHFDRGRMARAIVIVVDDIRANFQNVTAMPLLTRQLERRQYFELVCRPGPPVESIAAQSFRAHQQVLVALAICIALESRISERRVGGGGGAMGR